MNRPYFIKSLALASFLLTALVLKVPTSYATDRLVPGTYATIQQAIDAAVNGDVVIVAAGTYTRDDGDDLHRDKNLDFRGKAITVKSASGPASTIINCQNIGSAFSLSFEETNASVIEGFKITGASNSGIRCNDASPKISNCIFDSNVKNGSGGGIELIWDSSPFIINCIFTNNSAFDGGGIEINTSSWGGPIIINCIFKNNTANASDGHGGGIDCWSGSTSIINCCFYGNTGYSGGGINVSSFEVTKVFNSILWANSGTTGNQIDNAAILTVGYSDIQGGVSGIVNTGTITYSGSSNTFTETNINADPNFISTSDFHLQTGSPCIDTGTSDAGTLGTSLPATDIEGNQRILDGDGNGSLKADMGAYEYLLPKYVPDNYSTIQAAINASVSGDLIIVRDGTYTGTGNKNIEFFGKNLTLRSEHGPETTIIDCQKSGRGFYIHAGETRACVIDGFTITNGYMEGEYGGGIKCTSSPTIKNCRLISNKSIVGGGICTMGNPSISKCFFEKNEASSGGGLYNQLYRLEISDCIFRFNKALEKGGGISQYLNVTGNSIIINCLFSNNSARYGGGFHRGYGDDETKFINCAFISNRAEIHGGGIQYHPTYSDHAVQPLNLINCSFIDNYAGYHGGGIFGGELKFTDFHATIANCLFWGNTSASRSNQISFCGINADINIRYSVLEGGLNNIEKLEGANNIDFENVTYQDPKLMNTDDYHFSATSSCKDAGDNSSIPQDELDLNHDGDTTEIVPYDIDGNGRKTGTIVDIGAFEYMTPVRPIILLSPHTISFSAIEGTDPPSAQTLLIKNRGAGTLNWSISYNCPWLMVSPESGICSSSDAEVKVKIDIIPYAFGTDHMPHGEYECALTVADSAALNSPQILPISLSVNKILRVENNGNIQAAIDDAIDGDTVILPDRKYIGTGNRNISFKGKKITVRSEFGPDFCIIDCEDSARGFIFDSGETSSSVLEGVTIKNGNAVNNDNGWGGGAIYSQWSPLIKNCLFKNNKAYRQGAACDIRGAYITIMNCTFEGNQTSTDYGGAISIEGSYTTIANCFFKNNFALRAGAIHAVWPSLNIHLKNCIFYNNQAQEGDSGHQISYSSDGINELLIENCTLYYGVGTNFYHQEQICSDISNDSNLIIKNSIIYLNKNLQSTGGWDIGSYNQENTEAIVQNCDISQLFYTNSDYPDYKTNTKDDPLFKDLTNSDFRLKPASPCIDKGMEIEDLFTDIRGSVRPVDGDLDGTPEFDIGAYEWSEYYGGADGDQTTKPFMDISINGTVIATDFEYKIEWKDKNPFPYDPRVYHNGEYTVNLALVSDTTGRRIELGTYTVETSQQGYTIPFTFGPDHIGENWRIRVELATDPNAFELSDKTIKIQNNAGERYAYGSQIDVPDGANSDVKPDISGSEESASAFYWSTDTKKLYAVGQTTAAVITWYNDDMHTHPFPVVVYTEPPNPSKPNDPKINIYIAGSQPVDLLPAGTAFDLAELKYASMDGAVQENRFSASSEGWAVIYYEDYEASIANKEKFDVVRILNWNHTDTSQYGDPAFPIEGDNCFIGKKITDEIQDETSGKTGYVFFENSYYDCDTTVYDRTTRKGDIIAVNTDVTGLINDDNDRKDDLVVVWYKASESSGIYWPAKPVRYSPQWPADPKKIIIASQMGTGPLDPAVYGSMANMMIYNQPDRSLPGFNPNDEHAAFFTAQGSTYPAVFALRTDINNYNGINTSDPYVLLKFKNPTTLEWQFETYKVVPESGKYNIQPEGMIPDNGSAPRYYLNSTGNLAIRSALEHPDESYYIDADGYLVNPAYPDEHYNYSGGAIIKVTLNIKKHYIDANGQLQATTEGIPDGSYSLDVHGVIVESDVYYRFHYQGVAGQEINAPYPLNQLTFGPCAQSYITPGFENNVLKDKDKKVFARNGGINEEHTCDMAVKYFYKLQAGFFYDLNNDGYQDKTAGTPISWLDGLDGTFDGLTPNDTFYSIQWPDEVPSLFVGETLTDAKTQSGESVGLPNVKDQCIVEVLFDQCVAEGGDKVVKLIDPLYEHSADYIIENPESDLPDKLKPKRGSNNRWIFTALPYHLQARLTFDEVYDKLKLKGLYQTGTGEPLLLLNTLSKRDIMEIARPFLPDPNSLDPSFSYEYFLGLLPANLSTALDTLKSNGETLMQGYLSLKDAEMKALTAGNAQGPRIAKDYAGEHPGYYVTLGFNNDADDCPGPVTLSIIKVCCPLYVGQIKVIESDDAFEEKVTLRYNGDFGGSPDLRWFQWKYLTADFSGIPIGPDNPLENWKDYTAIREPGTPTKTLGELDADIDPEIDTSSTAYNGAVDVIIQGTGQQLLPDKWFSVRYYYNDICGEVSDWTEPQLYEGWIKRVMKKINLFDQKIKDFREAEVDTLASMISLAGRRYEGAVALNSDPDNLNNLGIIEVYGTLFDRGKDLTIDQGLNETDCNKAILFAANRLADLYMLIGNEAYGDAQDPTIGFSTEDGQYGTEAPSIFCFQNQVDSLLEEELALLRGRDDDGMAPFYNRLIWNFTLGDGEVAYKENYNITDQDTDNDGDGKPDGPNGIINEKDAMKQYPQGHGDAWGHYLTAVKYYYDLLKNPNFVWIPQTEAILVDQTPVEVDYRDERKFASAASAKAKTGSEIVKLTYIQNYTENPEDQWNGYKDEDPLRAWGVDEWARRAGLGAYVDWVVGNSILPPEYRTPVIAWESQNAQEGQTQFTLEDLLYDVSKNYLRIYINDNEVAVGTDVAISEDSYGKTVLTFSQALTASNTINANLYNKIKGIQKVDRTTVLELAEIASQYNAVQAQMDLADNGLNPLGLAKDTIPFDIDPGEVSNNKTHFEQIYERAVQAMNNAIAVFNHANQSSSLLRRQQDSLADFKRNIDNTEADYNNRLIEVFGYPYPDDCGPGKTYNTLYAETGPDLYHYMYVDPSELMGVEAPKTHQFTMTFKNIDADATGGLTEEEKVVTFHVDTDSRFGLIKPSTWTGRRKAPGEIQMARSDLLQVRGRFEKALMDYDNLIGQIENQADLIEAQYDLNANEINVLNASKATQQSLNDAIKNARYRQLLYRKISEYLVLRANASSEAIPSVVGVIAGLACGTVTDILAPVRGAVKNIATLMADVMSTMADLQSIAELDQQQAKEISSAETNITLTSLRGDFAVEQQLLQLENMVRSEAPLRQEIYLLAESMQQSSGRYLSAMAKGERILTDRLRFRKQTAAQIQDYRYKDMTFRIFRNDALQKYRAQFDMAAMYVYLAAKAYDYETALLDTNSMAGQRFLSSIVEQRTIGMIESGIPLTGSGLADPMKRMWQNFQVLKGQMGFNNPQIETNRFSLRKELFRIQMDETSNDTWREALNNCYVEDLWDVPEFRRYCKPFGTEGTPQPGLVIPFNTTVTSGLNFFEWPLAGGDSYYSSTNFATKVRSVGVWFSNYNSTNMAETPRVYLVPVGEDILRAPVYGVNEIRSWHIVDQKLPMPFPISENELDNNTYWIPMVDTIFDEFVQIRRHSDFRAYHDSGYLNQSEMTFDSRLIGRSVWNTKWVLIIPGQNLLYDAEEGIQRFINGPMEFGTYGDRTGYGISDIKIFFQTYAYSGRYYNNK